MTVRKRTAWLVAAAVAVSAAWPSAAPSTWSKAALTAILDQYASGNYEAATRAIAAIDQLSLHESQDTPETPFTNWQHAAPDWIRKGSSTAESNRRKLIAATVALDIVRAHPEVGLLQRLPFLAWACTRVRDHATGSDVAKSGTSVRPAGPPACLNPTRPSFVIVSTCQLCWRIAAPGSIESKVSLPCESTPCERTRSVPPR